MRREPEVTAQPHELGVKYRPAPSWPFEIAPECGRRIRKTPTLEEIDRGEVDE